MAKKGKNPFDVEAGRRIRKARGDRGWSQEELAIESGWKHDRPVPRGAIHPSSVAMYERGERRIPREIAETLSHIFGRPAAYWLGAIDDYEADVLQALQRPRTAAGGR